MAAPTKERTKAARPTRDELADYFPRDEKIGTIRREANDLAKLQRHTEAKALAYALENGGAEKCAIVCGYRLVIGTQKESVKWEEALLDELAKYIGKDKAAKRVEQLRKAAGSKLTITIEPPSAS